MYIEILESRNCWHQVVHKCRGGSKVIFLKRFARIGLVNDLDRFNKLVQMTQDHKIQSFTHKMV